MPPIIGLLELFLTLFHEWSEQKILIMFKLRWKLPSFGMMIQLIAKNTEKQQWARIFPSVISEFLVSPLEPGNHKMI